MTHFDRLLMQAVGDFNQGAVAEIVVSYAGELAAFSVLRALEWASENGHAECARLILSWGDLSKYDHSTSIFRAALRGHAECVKLLIVLVSEETCQLALRNAAGSGHLECVNLLIQKCDPKKDESIALSAAAASGHLECVKALIPLTDPSAGDFRALVFAVRAGHLGCVKLLIPVSNGVDLYVVFTSAAESRQASCVAALWDLAPSLRRQVDVFKFMAKAAKARDHKQAAFFRSIIEQRLIAASAGPRGASSSSRSTRI